MVKVHGHARMDRAIKASGKSQKEMAKASGLVGRASPMRVSGSRVNTMAKACIRPRMGRFMKAIL